MTLAFVDVLDYCKALEAQFYSEAPAVKCCVIHCFNLFLFGWLVGWLVAVEAALCILVPFLRRIGSLSLSFPCSLQLLEMVSIQHRAHDRSRTPDTIGYAIE